MNKLTHKTRKSKKRTPGMYMKIKKIPQRCTGALKTESKTKQDPVNRPVRTARATIL